MVCSCFERRHIFVVLTAVNKVGARRHLELQDVAIPWRRLMSGRPIRIPNAALTGRRQVSGRYTHVRGVWFGYDDSGTSGEENGKSKGDCSPPNLFVIHNELNLSKQYAKADKMGQLTDF